MKAKFTFPFGMHVLRNPYNFAGILGGACLGVFIIYTPPFHVVFGGTDLPRGQHALILSNPGLAGPCLLIKPEADPRQIASTYTYPWALSTEPCRPAAGTTHSLRTLSPPPTIPLLPQSAR